MAIYPGATAKLIEPSDQRNFQGRAIFHVAVSRSRSLRPSGGNSWHMYVAEDGYAEQYVDDTQRAYANVDANDDAFSVETAGAANPLTVDTEPWTEAQCHTLAGIWRWQHDLRGVPFDILPDSMPGRRGVGTHRLGIDPWRVPNGEKWSTSRGKRCPGDAKIAQLPYIRDLAAGGVPGVVIAPAAPVISEPPRIPGVPGLPAWFLPRGHYFGNVAGPAASHGGYYPNERDAVRAIQRRFIAAGCVDGVGDWRSGWADGKWENATDSACREWFRRYRPGQQYTDRIYSDDYAILAR